MRTWRAVITLKKALRGRKRVTLKASSCQAVSRKVKARQYRGKVKSVKLFAPGAKRAIGKCPLKRQKKRKVYTILPETQAWIDRLRRESEEPFATMRVDGKRVNLY